jgi:hypothetical protein
MKSLTNLDQSFRQALVVFTDELDHVVVEVGRGGPQLGVNEPVDDVAQVVEAFVRRLPAEKVSM